jgi:hypothetical protein
MGWRNRRQRKWKKDKEKGIWTKKVESGKEAQRETQERRYEAEGTSKKDNEDGKSEGIILERSRLKKKRRRRFRDYVRQFEIVGLVEERSWEKNRKAVTQRIQMGMLRGKTRKEETKRGGAEFWKFLELIF